MYHGESAQNGTLVSDMVQSQELSSVLGMITTTFNSFETVQQAAIEILKVTSSTNQTEWLELLSSGFWHILLKLRFLFYLVWPTDTMFSSLDQVPRYVAEVSTIQLPISPGSNSFREG